MAYNIPLMNKSFDLLGPYLFINYLIKPILFQIVFSRKMDNLQFEILISSQNEKFIDLDLNSMISK